MLEETLSLIMIATGLGQANLKYYFAGFYLFAMENPVVSQNLGPQCGLAIRHWSRDDKHVVQCRWWGRIYSIYYYPMLPTSKQFYKDL